MATGNRGDPGDARRSQQTLLCSGVLGWTAAAMSLTSLEARSPTWRRASGVRERATDLTTATKRQHGAEAAAAERAPAERLRS